MRGSAALLLALALIGSARAQGETERWFVGELGGRACLAAREARGRLPAGGWSTRYDLELRIVEPAPRRCREHHEQEESSNGALLGFRYDVEGEGVLVGRVTSGTITATLWSDGVRREHELQLRGARLVGRVGQRLQISALQRPGDTTTYSTLVLTAEGLGLGSTTATLIAIGPSGQRTVDTRSDLDPVVRRLDVDAGGELIELGYDIQGKRMVVRASAKPPVLSGAHLDPVASMRSEGLTPSAFGHAQRYELPAALVGLVARDGHQHLLDGVLEVHMTPRNPEEVERLVLQPPDFAELAAWVQRTLGETPGSVPTRVERLRDAVRTWVSPGGWGAADAPPAETFRRREGDCTEVARLLCAVLQLAEVPARVDVGLVYQPFRARWEAHAWVSAYDPESRAWVHADATAPTLPRTFYIRMEPKKGGLVPTATGLVAALDAVDCIRNLGPPRPR